MAKFTARSLSIVALLAAVAFVATIAFLVFGAPRGLVGYRTAFDTLRTLAYVGGVGAGLSLLLTLVARSAAARVAAAAATLIFAAPVTTMIANEATPPPGDAINDITTDLENPPEFSAVIPLREPGSNPIEYGGAAVAVRQREAHPEVIPLQTRLDKEAAFQLAFETAEALDWEIVAADLHNGIIEAVDTTPFFRFKDDVVIRVSPQASGSRVDLRSRSRVGRSDLGKNAARIMEFSEAFTRADRG